MRSPVFILKLVTELLAYSLVQSRGYLLILSVSVFILKLVKKLLAYSFVRSHVYLFILSISIFISKLTNKFLMYLLLISAEPWAFFHIICI